MTSFVLRKPSIALAGGCLALVLLATSCATKAEKTDVPAKAENTDISALLKTAASGSGQERTTAIDHLGDQQASAAIVVPALHKLLEDKDPLVRWHSARSLGDFGEQAKEAVPDLQKQLKHEDPIVAYHAAVALGKIGDKSDATVDALVTAVTHPDKRVARAAIAALRNLKPGPARVSAALEKALEADDDAVVMYAIDAIVEHGKEAAPLLNAMLKHPRTAYIAAAAIEQIGPDAKDTVPALVDLLSETKHSQMQIQTLLALGRIGPDAKPAAPQIITLMESTQDATVPVAAAFALGAIGATDADPNLRAALTKDNAFLQMVSAWALAKLHPEDAALKQQALDKLTAGSKSDDEAIRSAAEKGLKSLAPPEKPAATP